MLQNLHNLHLHGSTKLPDLESSKEAENLLHLLPSIHFGPLPHYTKTFKNLTLCRVHTYVQSFDGYLWDALMVCNDTMSCKRSICIRLKLGINQCSHAFRYFCTELLSCFLHILASTSQSISQTIPGFLHGPGKLEGQILQFVRLQHWS